MSMIELKDATITFGPSKLEAERIRLMTELRDLSTPDAALSMPARDRQRQLKKISDDYVDVILELYHEIVVGILNGHGIAYIGPSYGDGLAFRVETKRRAGESKVHARRRAAMQAYSLLLKKLGRLPKDLPHVWQL